MSVFRSFLKNAVQLNTALRIAQVSTTSIQFKNEHKFVYVPKPGTGKSYRRKVHYPEEYTVTPLETTHLGGRDPETGRRVVKTLGGGVKHKYHWIKWVRDGPSEGPPQEERVLRILKCGCRTALVALVAVKDQLKYILASENMKPGDILKTSKFIPRNPVLPNEGDAYPLGALPLGTLIHNVQIDVNSDLSFVRSAGSCAVIKRYLDGKVVVQLPSKKEIKLSPNCMATVGRLSNVEHSSIPIGSPQKLRELGYRPRSGLWQRKTGRFGRKIKPLKPPEELFAKPPKPEIIRCTLEDIKI